MLNILFLDILTIVFVVGKMKDLFEWGRKAFCFTVNFLILYSKVGCIHANSINMESSDRGLQRIITLSCTLDTLEIL